MNPQTPNTANTPNPAAITFNPANLPITRTELIEEILAPGEPAQPNLFKAQTANEWMHEAALSPMPRRLFGEFWWEGELCILFADTNVGKSILAVQISDSISRGSSIEGFPLTADRQKVLYIDFELSKKQFQLRYTNAQQQFHVFDDNLIRAEMDLQQCNFQGMRDSEFEDYIYASLDSAVLQQGAKVLIIDNITYMKSQTEKAAFALPLMKELQMLKLKHNISILALAHTPKRDMAKMLSKNDIQGSKMLVNFCDSAFAIGESTSDDLRYLKQIKVRNDKKNHDYDNVCVCRILKEDNFLKFQFLHCGNEKDYLKEPEAEEKNALENEVKELLEAEPGITAYAVAKKLCEDETRFESFRVRIARIVNRLKKAPDVTP